MTDLTEDELREAVELAEGWELSPSGLMAVHAFGPSEYEFTSTEIADPEQYMLDALAMQLARQARDKWPSTWWEDDGKPWPTNVRDAWLAASAVSDLLGDGDSAGAIRAILKARAFR